jgi:NAD(P)-dependent dehydrogenase (short-subunit alcohol dehydrogenase family)
MATEDTETLHRLFCLEGKSALVTGAGGGLGSALAEGLAGAGAAVALADLPGSPALREVHDRLARQGYTVSTVEADLSDVSVAPTMVQQVVDRHGSIDILVNCAGINQREPILEVTPEVYDRIMTVNLRAVYFLSQAVARAMKDNGSGKIINVGSLTSAIALSDVSVYGCTKSAVAQLTKTMAVEWAQYNIQVNAIGPGFMRTPLSDPVWANPTRRGWMEARIPARRGGEPDELVGVAILLASPASSYISGQIIFVDGGFLAGSPW